MYRRFLPLGATLVVLACVSAIIAFAAGSRGDDHSATQTADSSPRATAVARGTNAPAATGEPTASPEPTVEPTAANGTYYVSLDSAPVGLAWDVRYLVGGVVKVERLGVVVSGPVVLNVTIPR